MLCCVCVCVCASNGRLCKCRHLPWPYAIVERRRESSPPSVLDSPSPKGALPFFFNKNISRKKRERWIGGFIVHARATAPLNPTIYIYCMCLSMKTTTTDTLKSARFEKIPRRPREYITIRRFCQFWLEKNTYNYTIYEKKKDRHGREEVVVVIVWWKTCWPTLMRGYNYLSSQPMMMH